MKAIIKPHGTLVISWRPAGIRFEMSPPHSQQFEITYIPRKFVAHFYFNNIYENANHHRTNRISLH